LLSCSVPNLEPPECDQARDVVREFYSMHFGSDMTLSPENLEKRRLYLTPGFYESIENVAPPLDPFTRTSDPPKAFRAGECRVIQPDRRVAFDILLFWKTDTRSEQRSIPLEAVRSGDTWVIDAIGDASGS
jgi:hypothetical protein